MTNLDKWKVVKYIAFAIIVLMSVVLVIQFVNLSKLQKESWKLNQEYQTMQQELADKTAYKQELENNPSYVQDTAKEKYNMKNSNEEVIVAEN